MSDPKPLVLIDGSSFMFRAFFAAKTGFSTKSGIPTGASLIITRMLQNLIKKFSGSKIICVFDAKGKSFRSELYPEYKANRPPLPEELKVQIDYVFKIVKALGLPLVSVPKVEADDVLGTYARLAQQDGVDTVICTGDKDMAQLVNEHVSLYDSMNDKYYDRNSVIEKYGVPPELIIDFLALKGDASDNIPGMKGVGDKTALALLNGIGGIDELFLRKDEIARLGFKGAKNFKEKLEAAESKIRLSYDLATIRTDVTLPISIEEVVPPKADVSALLGLFKELEFTKLAKELLSAHNQTEAQARVQADSVCQAQRAATELPSLKSWQTSALTKPPRFSGEILNIDTAKLECLLIDTEEKLESLCKKIRDCGLVALDTETTSLRPEEAKLVGMSFAVREREGFYLPLSHSYLGCPKLLEIKLVKKLLEPVLNDPKVKIVGHNIKFDLLVLHYAGIEVGSVYADTMLMAHLLNSAQSVGMDYLALSWLNYKTISYKEVTGERKKISISEASIEDVCRYAGEDAEVTLRFYQLFKRYLEQKPWLERLFFEMDMPFLKVLYHMELEGVFVDGTVLAKQNAVLKSELKQIQDRILELAGEDFNISSPKQLGKMLFEKLRIPYPKKLKEGQAYSTAEEVLHLISSDYDIVSLVLRYRELSKLITTYTEKLQTLINANGRIYTSFNQAGTVTGRLSSSDPNLQNIPARTAEGKLIRKAFSAPKGYSIVSADYSQIELRLIAHFSQDRNLIKAFRAGLDIHKSTAAEVLGKDISEVTPQERSHAKATNFGLMYGMGAFGLRRQTGMGMAQAKDYINRYFERYPGVLKYMEQTKSFAREHGFVTTISGREIAVSNIQSGNPVQIKAAERAAINAPMQGSAADIIKKAMIDIYRWIETLPVNTVRMTVQVHDELVFEVKDDFIEIAERKIAKLMEDAWQLSVPLTVGIGSASNWGDAH